MGYSTCFFKIVTHLSTYPVSWGRRITLAARLQKGMTPLPQECPRYDIKQSDGEALGNVEYPFIAIVPRSTLIWSASTR